MQIKLFLYPFAFLIKYLNGEISESLYKAVKPKKAINCSPNLNNKNW